MRLFGTYAFEKLRQAFQGVFDLDMTVQDGHMTSCYITLWQITFQIFPNQYILVYLLDKDGRHSQIGKINMS